LIANRLILLYLTESVIRAGIREESNPYLFLGLWQKSVAYTIYSKVLGFLGVSYLAAARKCRVKKKITFAPLDNLLQIR